MAKTTTGPQTEEDTIEVSLEEATHAQLMWFSKYHMNLDIDEAETQNQTYNRLKAAWDHPVIKVPRVINPPKAVSQYGVSETYSQDERFGLPEFVTIIAQGMDDDEDDTLKLAHNGKTFIIKKGEPVTIPWYVYQGCIVDAKAIVYQSGRDTGLGPERFVQAVQYTRLK
jgi:hypothetical protein